MEKTEPTPDNIEVLISQAVIHYQVNSIEVERRAIRAAIEFVRASGRRIVSLPDYKACLKIEWQKEFDSWGYGNASVGA